LAVAASTPPLWQVAQPLLTLTLAWKRPLAQVLRLPRWQVSQLADAAALMFWYGRWLPGLPSAGGKPPLWQVAHWPLTAVWV
jgi:hypothetical protein